MSDKKAAYEEAQREEDRAEKALAEADKTAALARTAYVSASFRASRAWVAWTTESMQVAASGRSLEIKKP